MPRFLDNLAEWSPDEIVLAFDPRDIWIGLYWDTITDGDTGDDEVIALDAYVCIVPMLPIRFTWGAPKDER